MSKKRYVCAFDCGHRTFTVVAPARGGLSWCWICGRYVGVIITRIYPVPRPPA